MQDSNENSSYDQPRSGEHAGERLNSNIVPFQCRSVNMHDLVTGQIVDKRRLAISAQRMGRALCNHDRTLGDSIIETGVYTVVVGSMTLEQSEEEHGMRFNPLNQPNMGMYQPMTRAGGYMGIQQIQFAVFSDLTQLGVQISLHPAVGQNIGALGSESAIVNMALGLLMGDTGTEDIGFGK